MAEEADRFRSSAERCRSLAIDARDQIARDELNDIAAELDAEADKIDAEEALADVPPPEPPRLQ